MGMVFIGKIIKDNEMAKLIQELRDKGYSDDEIWDEMKSLEKPPPKRTFPDIHFCANLVKKLSPDNKGEG